MNLPSDDLAPLIRRDAAQLAAKAADIIGLALLLWVAIYLFRILP